MFDKIADFIMKHSKAIVVVWIVILLASVYPALKVNDVMSYDLNEMADSDLESIRGLVIIGEEFVSDNTVPNVSEMQILVIKYHNDAEKIAAGEFIEYLNAHLNDYNWTTRPTMIMDGSGYIAVDEGIELGGIVYSGQESTAVIDGTAELRSYIRECKASFASSDKDFACYLTGTPAISYDMEHNAAEDISRIDPFTIALILILVGLFFRSFVASATPPVTIGFAYAVTLGGIFLIGQALNIFYITEMMILVAMMGAGCDYCIFIISRYREELMKGKDHHESLRESIIWAGESIATSGASVIIGFGAMAICKYSLVGTMGLCLALGILVALLAALTLIPAVLNLIGGKIFWPTKISKFMEGSPDHKGWHAWFGKIGKKYFHWSAKFSIKHAWLIVLVAVIVTVPAAYAAITNETSYDMISSMQSGDSGEGMDLLEEYANLGILMPNYVVLEYKEPVGYVQYTDVAGVAQPVFVWSPQFLATEAPRLQEYTLQLAAADDNVASVDSIFMWKESINALRAAGMSNEQAVQFLQNSNPYIKLVVDRMYAVMPDYNYIAEEGGPMIDYEINCHLGNMVGGSFAKVENPVLGQPYPATFIKISMATHASAMSPTSMDTISKMQKITDSFAAGDDGVKTEWATGTAVVMYDVSVEFKEEFKTIEVLVVILIVLLLFFVMKSYLIPIRSVITILMSISWTLALTHIVFVNLLGGEVIWLIPLMLLVICLGLGMDYDILLTTRIKENVSKGMSNDDAIYGAVTHTGSIITICGLIMGGAFGTLMLSGMEMMQEFGFALCFAILVDALLVRTYVVPAVMHLLGDAAWVGPKFLKKKVAFGRGFTASQGLLAAAIMIVFAAVAYFKCGMSYDIVTMKAIFNYSSICKTALQIAFALGGLALFAFGSTMIKTNPNCIGKAAGFLYMASSVAMIIASFCTFGKFNPDAVWAGAFALSVAASALYAGFAMKTGHGAVAGTMMIAILGLGAATVCGTMSWSFGLMCAAVLSILFAALGETAKIE